MATKATTKPKEAAQVVMTPTQLAERLAGKEQAQRVAKAFVRPYLRRHFARAKEAHGTSWNLNAEQVNEVKAAWDARVAGKVEA